MQKVNINVVILGIIILFILEVIAMLKGINGGVLRIVVILIAGMCGLSLPSPFKHNTGGG